MSDSDIRDKLLGYQVVLRSINQINELEMKRDGNNSFDAGVRSALRCAASILTKELSKEIENELSSNR